MAKTTLTPEMREQLSARLRYYRELGIHDFYRRTVTADSTSLSPAPVVVDDSARINSPEASMIKTKKSALSQAAIATPVQDRAAALAAIRADLGECVRCPLHAQGRTQIVFGTGNPQAELMFIGEAPGADEDRQGEPFVGRAGQLLNNMIAAMGLRREDVYIANVIKCRPPGNRTPNPEECAVCSPFLLRQIEVVAPQAIVALGAVAAKTLLAVNQSMNSLRGRWYEFHNVPLAVTFHPAYLLRNPPAKKDAWQDLQMVMKRLGLKAPAKK
jgi:uracil-DNA glycosylase family 4